MSGPAEDLLQALLTRDASGRSWLPGLLAAAPRGRDRLGPLAGDPGSIVTMLAVRGADGRFGAFSARATPPREMLEWYIEHPEALQRPPLVASPGEERLRRALLDDDPPGARARAQERARELLATRSPLTSGWWRFEELGTLDCLLMTHRLVVTVVTHISEVTPWFPARSSLVRALEAARATAQGHRWATLVIAEEPVGDAAVANALAAGTPYLDAEGRAALAAAYLGSLTPREACDAAGVSPELLETR